MKLYRAGCGCVFSPIDTFPLPGEKSFDKVSAAEFRYVLVEYCGADCGEALAMQETSNGILADNLNKARRLTAAEFCRILVQIGQDIVDGRKWRKLKNLID